MSFRSKLLAFFTLAIISAVALVAWGVSVYSRRAFEEFDRQRTDALVAQFRREYAQRGEEIVHRMQGVADAEATLRMAMDLNRPQADASQYYNDARGIAQAQQLDFVDIVGDDGTLISSSEWPARFGYKNDWVASQQDWNAKGAFLQRVDTPDAVDLGLLAVRTVNVGDKRIFLVGGQRLDQNFLATLVLPEGMRALLYRNLERGFVPSALTDEHGQIGQADLFLSLIGDVQTGGRELQRTIDASSDGRTSSESFDAIPLQGRDGGLLGILLVGSSRQRLVQMLSFIRALALLVAGGVILLGVVLGWWISARVTRPIEKLAAGAREVAAGHWGTHVEVRSHDEVGQLSDAFNEMTRQLAEQRERLVQTERVAAWRELARRLAHELKNPLFPLQLTVENLQRAKEQSALEFDEVFFESTTTLRAELENLKAIVSRFSDFAKMPPPEFASVDVNESVRNVVKLFEPQLSAVGRPSITPELYLEENLSRVQADPVLLRRAIDNLVLNSLDAMPAGGTLTIRTSRHDRMIRLEVSDTGAGLTPEECARVFTPYYTSKRHGTGLGLAIVQSVISDHGGTISVESVPGAGATFRIELPIRQVNQPDHVRESELANVPDRRSRKESRPEKRAETPGAVHTDKPNGRPDDGLAAAVGDMHADVWADTHADTQSHPQRDAHTDAPHIDAHTDAPHIGAPHTDAHADAPDIGAHTDAPIDAPLEAHDGVLTVRVEAPSPERVDLDRPRADLASDPVHEVPVDATEPAMEFPIDLPIDLPIDQLIDLPNALPTGHSIEQPPELHKDDMHKMHKDDVHRYDVHPDPSIDEKNDVRVANAAASADVFSEQSKSERDFLIDAQKHDQMESQDAVGIDTHNNGQKPAESEKSEQAAQPENIPPSEKRREPPIFSYK